MKHLLFVVLENTKESSDIIHELSNEGYNGTVISSTSLKHLLQDEKEDLPSFFSLSHIHHNNLTQNTTIYFILEDEDLEKVRQLIREKTDHFQNTKGGMFSTPIESYEGSF